MTIQEKLGLIYAKIDCGGRHCENCINEKFCFCHSDKDLRDVVLEVQAEIRTVINEQKEEAK